MKKKAIIPINEKVEIPRGGYLMRRFPGSALKIAMYLDKPLVWYEALSPKGDCLHASKNYDECLWWCENHKDEYREKSSCYKYN